jgi:ribosomal protein S18 acetylase RimI-like enzyme
MSSATRLPIAGATVRRPVEADHPRVLDALAQWWRHATDPDSVRQRSLLLPRLYFQHFTDASRLVERDGEVAGFLVGFLSASRPDEGYIHFVGVDPAYRGQGLACYLYEEFFDHCRRHGRSVVHAITSPNNAGSYAFHLAVGFTAEPGPARYQGRPVQPDYDGPGYDRVTFVRRL